MADNPAKMFAHQIRQALRRLYDPGELRQSPLMGVFGLDPEGGASALQNILLGGIEALKPRSSTPSDAPAWRTYRALHHRYTEQFTPQQVSGTLGLSKRQLRRYERIGLHALAEHLAVQHNLDLDGLEQQSQVARASEAAMVPTREQELEFLERSLPSQAVSVEEVVGGVLKTVQPLQRSLNVGIECDLPTELPRLAGRSATLRQALLNTLTAAIRYASSGAVHIAVRAHHSSVSIDVQPAEFAGDRRTLSEGCSESLEMARQLVALSGGSLQVIADGAASPFMAHLELPVAAQAVVLAIDDNGDTLRLIQRYITGTRFSFVGVRDPAQGLALAQELRPHSILLDVMLPGVDGWEVLGRLRENPVTHDIPVIVCTILPESELAMALGAAAFLRKPVMRADLVAALDRQVHLSAPGSSE